MTKRTRSEYERSDLPSATEGTVIATASELEPPVTEERSEEGRIAVGIPETQTPARVAVGEGLVDEVETANGALEGGLDNCPLWALLIRAGYVLW